MVRRQRTAFPPNFVHSLDGSHMMMTAVACKKEGLDFAGISLIGTFCSSPFYSTGPLMGSRASPTTKLVPGVGVLYPIYGGAEYQEFERPRDPSLWCFHSYLVIKLLCP